MKEQLVQPLIGLVATIVSLSLSLLIAELKKKLRSERASLVLDRIDHLTEDAVLWANQTVVDIYRRNGKLDGASVIELREMVSKRVHDHLTLEGIQEAKAALGLDDLDLRKLIATKIEAWVADAKANKPTPASDRGGADDKGATAIVVPPTPPSAG